MRTDKEKKQALARWLNKRLGELQAEEGRQTLTEIAKRIGVEYDAFLSHLRGSALPSAETVEVYAKALGSGVYGALGMDAPEIESDPRWQRIKEIYLNAPEDARRAIAERAQEYETAPKSSAESETASKAPSFRQGALISA